MAGEGPKPAVSEVLYRTKVDISSSHQVSVCIVELGDKHDYVLTITQSGYAFTTTTTHASGCRKCNPEPEPTACPKCKQKKECCLEGPVTRGSTCPKCHQQCGEPLTLSR